MQKQSQLYEHNMLNVYVQECHNHLSTMIKTFKLLFFTFKRVQFSINCDLSIYCLISLCSSFYIKTSSYIIIAIIFVILEQKVVKLLLSEYNVFCSTLFEIVPVNA